MYRNKLVSVLFIIVVAVGCGKSADDYIRDLDSDNSMLRRKAGIALTQGSGGPEAPRKLIALLESDNERLIFIATQILGSLADTSAVTPLGRMSAHQNPNIRESSVWSLGSIGHESALPYIIEALDDSVAGVRHSAVKALGYIHYPPAADYLFGMFRDEADSVRAESVHSLYLYRNDQGVKLTATDFAVPFKDKSDLVRYVTVQALGWDGFPDKNVAGEMLVEALGDQNKFVRLEAILSIKNIRYAPAVPRFKKMYDLATVDEEIAISEAIKTITGEAFPPEELE